MSDLLKKIMSNKALKDSFYTRDDYAEDQKPEHWFSLGTITANLLMAGRVENSIPSGKVIQICGPSKYGKSFMLACAIRSAQKKGKYAILFDVERAYDENFYIKLGIDVDKLLIVQENRIELVLQKFQNIVDDLTKEEKRDLFIGFDSWGALTDSASVKYALAGVDTRNMSMSQKKNNFARLLLGSGVTIAVINHIYDNTSGFGDPLKAAGGRQIEYLGQACLMLTSKAKDTDSDKEITGSIITAVANKTRYGKENSKLKFRIKNEGGLDYWYGLLDDAIDMGAVEQSGNRYSRPCVENDKKWWEKDIYCSEFWIPVFKNTNFKELLESKYSFRDSSLDIAEGKNDIYDT